MRRTLLPTCQHRGFYEQALQFRRKVRVDPDRRYSFNFNERSFLSCTRAILCEANKIKAIGPIGPRRNQIVDSRFSRVLEN